MGSNAAWENRLNRVWRLVLESAPKDDRGIANFSSGSSLLHISDHVVASYPIGKSRTGDIVRRYIWRVFYQTMNGNAVTAKYLIPAQSKGSGGKQFLDQRVETLAANDMPIPKASDGGAYSSIVRAGDKPEDLIDRAMAVQLLHELVHARLLFEQHESWPAQDRYMLPRYNAWAAPAWGPAMRAEREKLIKSVGSDKFTKLLNEKFSIDWAFHSFGGRATNRQIADNYTREDKDPAVKRAAKSAETFFDMLDKEHAKAAARQPAPVQTQPIQVGPRDAGVQPRYAPVNHPWRNQFPTIPRNSFSANPSGRYRPATMSPFNPNRWGPSPNIRSPNFGTQPRTITPTPAPRSTYMDNIRRGINPITRDIMGGRIQPNVRPSYIQPRPARLQRGGSGWDPSRVAFGTQTMNLMDRWRPDRRIMVPTQYGSTRYEFKGLIDRGSRDF